MQEGRSLAFVATRRCCTAPGGGRAGDHPRLALACSPGQARGFLLFPRLTMSSCSGAVHSVLCLGLFCPELTLHTSPGPPAKCRLGRRASPTPDLGAGSDLKSCCYWYTVVRLPH